MELFATTLRDRIRRAEFFRPCSESAMKFAFSSTQNFQFAFSTTSERTPEAYRKI